jgi:hypothetical protein
MSIKYSHLKSAKAPLKLKAKNHLIKNWTQDLNRYFIKEGIQAGTVAHC